jgi:hypothetical protein
MIKLSKTSKLDGIYSWSLNALDTCQGSIDPATGGLVPACSGCYATTGNYRFPNVKAPREFNKRDWLRPEWVSDMVMALDSSRYFRWFDSGDMYSVDLAEKIYQVMQATPWVKHWIPTRMAKCPKYKAIIAKMQALDNVSVRFSSDSVTGQYIQGLHGSVIVPDSSHATDSMTLCRAYENDGKCNGCRACYDKSVDLIAYPAHGKSMAKVIRIALAA